MKRQIDLNIFAIIGIIFIAAISRLWLYAVPNVSPVTAIALFGGAYFANKRWAYLIPLAAMWVTDLLLNNIIYAPYFEGFVWGGSLWVYGGLILIIFMASRLLHKIDVGRVIGVSLCASLLFFFITNFGSWISGFQPYPKTFGGLLLAYEAGLPFLRYSFLGDLAFTGVLFGAYELMRRRIPALALQS